MAAKAHGSWKLGAEERDMEVQVAAGYRACAATGNGSSQGRSNHSYSVKEINRDMATWTQHCWTHVRRQARLSGGYHETRRCVCVSQERVMHECLGWHLPRLVHQDATVSSWRSLGSRAALSQSIGERRKCMSGSPQDVVVKDSKKQEIPVDS